MLHAPQAQEAQLVGRASMAARKPLLLLVNLGASVAFALIAASMPG